jgi:hypothetical protein
MARKLTVEQWLKKAEAIASEPGDWAIAVYHEKDEVTQDPLLSDEPSDTVLRWAKEKREGIYVIIDAEGKVSSQCAINRQGERQKPSTFHEQRSAFILTQGVSDSWERQVNSLSNQNDKLQKRIDDLEERLEAARNTIMGLEKQLLESVLEADDDDPMIGLAKEIFDYFKGAKGTTDLIKVVNEKGLLDKLTPSSRTEILGLLNSGALS